jgi:hypothetical protein
MTRRVAAVALEAAALAAFLTGLALILMARQ